MSEGGGRVASGRMIGEPARDTLDTGRPKQDRVGAAVVGVLFAAILCVQVSVAGEPNATPPDVLAYALVAATGVSLTWTATRPLPVMFGSLGLVLLYHMLGYPAIGTAWPLGPALGNAAYRGHTRAAATTIALVILGAQIWRIGLEPEPILQVVSTSLQEATVAAAVILTGYSVRSRQLLADETRERLRLAATTERQRTIDALAAERLRIARELHDVLAHTITLIGIHARVGREGLGDEETVTTALDVIDRATRHARKELRATIEVLRDDGQAPRTPLPTLSSIPGLIDAVRSTGLAVDWVVTGEPRPLEPALELSAFRIVQEALTNVVRHADAGTAAVTTHFGSAALELTVTDDGKGGVRSDGNGVIGMRERAEALGGRLEVSDTGRPGVVVGAHLPFDSPPIGSGPLDSWPVESEPTKP